MPKLNFRPEQHGFHFPNAFKNQVFPGVTTYGRCGGMALAALDYYLSSLPIPTHTPDHLGPTRVPADGTRLSQYIYDRLMNSIVHPNASRFILGPWVTDENCYHWSVRDEWPRIRSSIDRGRLVLLGLWSKTGGLASCHQVLAYGYATRPTRVYVYDNNYPDEEMELRPISASEGIREVDATGKKRTGWRGFFVHEVYDQSKPIRPPYIDIGLQDGVSLTGGGRTPKVGQRLECTATVRNYGDYPAGLRQLYIYVRGPNGENLDGLFGGGDNNSQPLQPGEVRVLHRVCEQFGTDPGTHTVGVSYLSEQDHWARVPPAAATAATERQIYLNSPQVQQVVDKWVDVPESAFDVSTGVRLKSGDEYELSALGQIWAGVWGTGYNGPNGWNRVDHDPKFPLHDGPQARPFSLLSKIGSSSAYTFVGEHRPRAPHADGELPLYLRINDDRPGNGNGMFRCRVQVWRSV